MEKKSGGSKMNIKKIIIAVLILNNLTLFAQDTLKWEYKVFYYPNGFKLSEGYMLNGKPDKYWITYYVNGQKKSEGNRKNFLLDSTWIFYSPNGDTLEKIEYLAGKKNGYHIKYFLTTDSTRNVPSSKELFVDNVKQGFGLYYHPNGSIYQKIPYKNNLKEGQGFEYDINGKLTALLEFRNDYLISRTPVNRYDTKGRKTGLWVEFYDNGKIKKEINYINDLPTGLAKEYSPGGKLIKLEKYQQGIKQVELNEKQIDTLQTKQISIKYEFYPDKKLKAVKSFKDSIAVGLHIYYNSDGTIQKAIQYNDLGEKIAEGLVDSALRKQGQWIFYENDSIVVASGSFVNNKKNGLWQFFYKNGKLRQVGNYELDKPTGKWFWYYPDEKLLRVEFYEDSLLNGYVFEFSHEGDTILKAKYSFGLLHGDYFAKINYETYIGKYSYDNKTGEWKIFYANQNTIKAKMNYLNNELNGKYFEYYENKNLKVKGEYLNGRKVGKWIFYSSDGNVDYVAEYSNDKLIKINDIKID